MESFNTVKSGKAEYLKEKNKSLPEKLPMFKVERQPKVKIQKPKILDELFHRSRQKRSVYYFTTGKKINFKKYDDFKNKEEKKENPFDLPPIDNLLKNRAIEQETRIKEKELDRIKPIYEKHTYKTRLLLNFPERLHIPFEEDKIEEGIVDIDKQFFTIVKGRPLREKRSDLKTYISNVKDGFLSRFKTGIIYDEIYLMERQEEIETRTIDGIKRNLQEYSTSFDEFLAKDNDRSMKLLRETSEEVNKTEYKREELHVAVENFIKVKCEIYELEIIWSKRKACKDFLFEISPESFKKRYEKELAAAESEEKEELAREKEISEEIKLSESLESLLEQFLNDDAVIKPSLYFTRPWELKFIFRDMELKNQNALLFLESLRKPNEMASACLHATNEYYEKETKIIEESLTDLEENILLEEKKAVALKEEATKLVETTFKSVVSGEKPILLHSQVQNTYEACIAPDGSNIPVLEMLKDLEVEYKGLLLELDKLPIEIVREAKMLVKEDTTYIFGQARDARKKINYLDILIRRMSRAVEPPVKKTTRPLLFRSRPPPVPAKPPTPPKEMTSDELERIHFFTDKTTGEVIDDSKTFYPLEY